MSEYQQCDECGCEFSADERAGFMPFRFLECFFERVRFCSDSCKTKYHNRKYYQENKERLQEENRERQRQKRGYYDD